MWIKLTGVLSAIIGILMLALRIKSKKVAKLKKSNAIHVKTKKSREEQDEAITEIKEEEKDDIKEITDKANSNNDRLGRFNGM